MKRLIRKAALPDMDFSGNTVSVVNDQPLGEEFAYKLEQTYTFIETIKDVSGIIKGKKTLKESDYQHLESCLETFNILDQNTFSAIPFAIDSLSNYMTMTKEYEDMWNEYQEKGMEAAQKSKNGEDVEELKQRINELGSQLYNNESEVKRSNYGVFFTQFFQKVSPDAISKLYNKSGEYYALSYNESIMNATDINEFIDYCSEHVTNKPEETQMSRTTYIKDYLLKDILGESYDSYMTTLKTYLDTSSTDALLQLASFTIGNPDLLELNARITDVSQVYRGMYFDSIDDEVYQEILTTGQIDTTGDYQYASTSETKSTAKNFASKGAGLLLTIQPGTIIYNSDLASGVFGEGEIIIDMSNSTILSIEEV